MSILRPTKAPNLPAATLAYSTSFQDQFENILRLYFNQIDNFSQQVAANLDLLNTEVATLQAEVAELQQCKTQIWMGNGGGIFSG